MIDEDYTEADRWDWDQSDDSQHCEHGTFIGSWWGPDIMCGLCEDGITGAAYQDYLRCCDYSDGKYTGKYAIANGTDPNNLLQMKLYLHGRDNKSPAFIVGYRVGAKESWENVWAKHAGLILQRQEEV